MVAAKYSVQVNGLTNIALTKLDVLSKFRTLKVCTGYKFKNEEIKWLPADEHVFSEVVPVYKEFNGWNSLIDQCASFDELPKEARTYIDFIEQSLEIPVKYISIGQRRDQIIFR